MVKFIPKCVQIKPFFRPYVNKEPSVGPKDSSNATILNLLLACINNFDVPLTGNVPYSVTILKL